MHILIQIHPNYSLFLPVQEWKFDVGIKSLYIKRLQDYIYKLETKENRLNWDQATCTDFGLKAVAYAAGSGPNSLLGCWLELSPPAITVTRSSKCQG